MTSWPKSDGGLVMDPWRFNPAAAMVAANRVIRAGPHAPQDLRQWVGRAVDLEEAMTAVIATRIAVAPIPIYGRVGAFRPGAPPLPHHPFVLSGDVPFLPADPIEAGGAMMAPPDFIETCFRHGVLRQSPLIPEDPIHAAIALIASPEWDALILPEMNSTASRMVRLQAVRAKGRAPGFEPSTAEDDQFEEWWQNYAKQSGT